AVVEQIDREDRLAAAAPEERERQQVEMTARQGGETREVVVLERVRTGDRRFGRSWRRRQVGRGRSGRGRRGHGYRQRFARRGLRRRARRGRRRDCRGLLLLRRSGRRPRVGGTGRRGFLGDR